MSHTITRKFDIPGVLTGQDVRVRRNLRDMRFLYGALVAVLISVAVLFGYLWSRLTVVNLGYEISKANSVRSSLVEQNRRLKIDFMKLKSPERIERIASAELKLVHPKGEQIIQIK